MGLRIIYGKTGTGKSSLCFSEIAKLIEKEENIYYITPEQFSFTAEKNLMGFLKEKAVMNAEVITFSRMANRALNEIGGRNKTNLSKCGKAMLIYSILSKHQNDFQFLGKSDENIEIGIQSITEFKKHGITLETLNKEIETIEDKYLKTKLEDIRFIYQNYEEQISQNYIEETDLLDFLAKSIENLSWIKNSIIYIDEFSGFTAQEYEVIKQFIKYAKQVNITMCIDNLERDTNPDIDIFYSNKQTLKKLVRIVDENYFQLEEPVELQKQYRLKSEELQVLSQNLYSTKSTKYAKDVENIHLFLAKNRYSEIENVAKTICKMVREKQLRYRDMAVITKNIDMYSSLVRSIFAKYDIPVFIDEKRDLNQNVIVQYVLSILDIFTTNYANEAMFNYIKLGFLDIEDDEIFKLENYCTKWGIKRNKWKEDFKYEMEDENKKQEIERLNEIRKQIIEPLITLKKNIDKEKTAINITKQIYGFLQEQNIEEKISRKVKDLEEMGLIDFANEYVESYHIILEVFDEIVLVFKEDKMNIDTYSKILKIGLKNSELGKIPATQDQVTLGDVDRTRSHKVEVVFVIGLNDGVFPSVNKDEGFLNDVDRERLKNDGIELANGTLENLYEENFNIYKVFTTAEQEMYLSYASSDGEGRALRPSILIHKMKKIFPKLEEQSDVITKQYEVVNQDITYEELLEKIYQLKNKEDIEKIWYVVYAWYKQNSKWNTRLEQDMEGLAYTNVPQKLKKENMDKLYGNTLHTSVSRLEQYRRCPFSYYLQYGLKVKPKEELKIQSFNTGSFMHETIDEFFKYVHENGLNLAELEEIDIQKIVSKIIDEDLELSKNYIFKATVKYNILVRRLKKIVSKALKYIIQTLIYSDFMIKGTEVEFDTKGEYKPIQLELEDGKRIEITGKIDRIDIAKEEDGNYLRIIDYKSSSKNIDLNEVYAGLQIQLLTYADAVCKEEDLIPAGIFYFSLLEQMVKADKKIEDEEIEELIRKNFKMKGLIIADVKVIKMNDNSLTTGTSKMVPAAISKSGEVIEKWTNGVKQEEFIILQKYIYQTIKEIGKEIFNGNIDLKPYYKNGKTPCEYCEYKSICTFDPRRKENTYNYINKLTKDDIIRKMKKEINEA